LPRLVTKNVIALEIPPSGPTHCGVPVSWFVDESGSPLLDPLLEPPLLEPPLLEAALLPPLLDVDELVSPSLVHDSIVANADSANGSTKKMRIFMERLPRSMMSPIGCEVEECRLSTHRAEESKGPSSCRRDIPDLC
jgi:hypothetical protein